MSAPSKITPQQISELAKMASMGATLEELKLHCEIEFQVRITTQSLHGRQEIKEAIQNRRNVQKIQAGEALQANLVPVTEIMTARMRDLAKEAEELRDKKLPVDHMYYKFISDRLKAIDSALAGYFKPYQAFMHWIVEGDSLQDDDNTEKSAQEYMKTLEKMIARKTAIVVDDEKPN